MNDEILEYYADIYIEHSLQETGLTFHEFLFFIGRLDKSIKLSQVEKEKE